MSKLVQYPSSPTKKIKGDIQSFIRNSHNHARILPDRRYMDKGTPVFCPVLSTSQVAAALKSERRDILASEKPAIQFESKGRGINQAFKKIKKLRPV